MAKTPVYAITETKNGITRVIAKAAILKDAEILSETLQRVYDFQPGRFSIIPSYTNDEDYL